MSVIKNQISYIFTIPPSLPSLPFAIRLETDEGLEELQNRTKEVFQSNQFKSLNILKEDGKVGTSTIFQSMILVNSPTNYPKEFSELLLPREQELVKKLFDDLKRGAKYPVVMGGLGDIENCDGIVEKKIISPTGGILTKFWGCEYLFKGYPERMIVEGMSLGKAMISIFPRKILMDSWTLKIAILFMFIFRRKKLMEYGHIISHTLNEVFVKKFNNSLEKDNKMEKEIKSAVKIALRYMLEDEGIITDRSLTDGNFIVKSRVEKKRLLWRIIANLSEFICFFLANDTAYRFPIQDVITNIDKTNLKKSVMKECQKIIDILLKRIDKTYGVYDKFYMASKIFILLLRISKRLRKFMLIFLLELDINKVKMDEDDWYFCLRRRAYNYGGKSFEERIEEARKMDKEKNNVSLQLINIKEERSGAMATAVKVTRL